MKPFLSIQVQSLGMKTISAKVEAQFVIMDKTNIWKHRGSVVFAKTDIFKSTGSKYIQTINDYR